MGTKNEDILKDKLSVKEYRDLRKGYLWSEKSEKQRPLGFASKKGL